MTNNTSKLEPNSKLVKVSKKRFIKLVEENKELKQEIKELQDTSLLKKLNKSLERIQKGHFITREKLGI